MLGITSVHAQLKIGLRFAPTLSFTRVVDKTRDDGNQTVNYSNGSATLGFSSGVVLDYMFKTNYAVSSGIMYTIKRGAVNADVYGKANWNMQMIQIPMTLKLFTNEIAPDVKLYFQLGFSPDFIITQKLKKYTPATNAQDPPPEKGPYTFFDISLWFGSGVEYRVGENTILFTGITYNRGLINLMGPRGAFNERNAPSSPPANSHDRYSVRADVVALDLGIKF